MLPERLAVCRLDPQEAVPAWATLGPFFSVTRTGDELSIVCPDQHVPPDVTCARGWRAFKLEGPFDFESIGILIRVATPLAEAGISIFVIATYNTDYVLVRESQFEHAVSILSQRRHRIQG